MTVIRAIAGFLFGLVSFCAVLAHAQVTDIDIDVEKLVREVQSYQTLFEENLDQEEALVNLATDLGVMQQEALAFGVALTQTVIDARARLDQLGPVPGEGEAPEPDIISEERVLLAEERAQANLLIGQLEDATIQAAQLRDDIAERRRELFAQTLSERYDIRAAFSGELWVDIQDRAQTLERRVGSWASFTWRTKPTSTAIAITLCALLGMAAFFASRRVFGSWLKRDRVHDAPTFFARLTVGFWFTLLPTLTFWLWLGLTYGIFDGFNLWRPDIAELVQIFFAGLAILFLVIQLSGAVFAPTLPNWRLINVPQRSAVLLHFLMILMSLVVVADAIISRFNVILGVSFPITVALSLLTSLAVGFVLIAMGRVRTESRANEDEPASGAWVAWVRSVLVVSGVALIVIAMMGYLGFARFVSQQIVITGAILATMYLGYRAAKAIGESNALAQTSIGESLRTRFDFSEQRVDQFGLVASGLLYIAVVAIGAPIVARAWGFPWNEIAGFARSLVTEISIGSISISLVGILAAFMLFGVGLWFTRIFQRWLDGTVLERSGVEKGARSSIRTAVGYAGVALAGLFAVSAAGIDLTQLAFVAGALSLGIGFGLQNIVNNFVSGLILLAERPFKAGDIIEAGGFTGTVNKVNVRATEITTFDRKTLILPNSELINGTVTNWIHKTTLGRIQIPVGVSYDSDAKQVHDMLVEIANDHPRVLSNPEPFVAFDNFGDSSLDFVLYAYLADIGFGLTVRTELRMAILERFRVAGIEIPFPQRDINIKQSSTTSTPTIVDPDAEFGVIDTAKKPQIEDD
ncbi:MAG: mechanosensitive ion channel domain-containing protein [Pseudomonadota bacterium]